MKDNESGRSMVETVLVLAIIGLLIFASLIGYNFVVNAWRTHQSVEQVNSLVVGMRAGNLSKRFEEKRVIPAQTVIRGLRTNGDLAVLPDSSDSYAQVMSLGTNSYMIELEVTPDTCASLLEEANGADLITVDVPKNGCKTNDCALIEDIEGLSLASWGIAKSAKGLSAEAKAERSERIKSVCGVQPKLSLVWGCAEGANSYFYDGKCQKCQKGQTQDAMGECCFAASMLNIGGQRLCNCPEGTVLDETGSACVECNTDADCDGKGYSHKVCNSSHKCVECLRNTHCSTPDGGVSDHVWNKKICNITTERCVECLATPDCPVYTVSGKTGVCDNFRCIKCTHSFQNKGDVGECPSTDPVCINKGLPDNLDSLGFSILETGAHCESCDTEKTWNINTQKCECPCGTKSDGTCINPCHNCPQERPFWDENKQECVECLTTPDCPSESGKVCDSGTCTCPCGSKANGTCTPCCAAPTPYYDTNSDKCVACLNDSHCQNDDCSDPNGKLCDLTTHTCETCATRSIDTQVKTSPLYVLRGKDPSNTSRCMCFMCKDDAPNTQQDTGCSSTEPMCSVSGSDGQDATNELGTSCHQCITSANCDPGYTCDPTNKKCVCACGTNADGSCKDCNVPCPEGTYKRDGECVPICSEDLKHPYWDPKTHKCVGCLNDSHCESDTASCPVKKDGKICHPAAKECIACSTYSRQSSTLYAPYRWRGNNGKNTKTCNGCYACINDQENNSSNKTPDKFPDTGCTSDKGLCNGEQGYAGNTCNKCIDDKTGKTKDTGCSDATPICGTKNDGQGTRADICSQCIQPSDCGDVNLVDCNNGTCVCKCGTKPDGSCKECCAEESQKSDGTCCKDPTPYWLASANKCVQCLKAEHCATDTQTCPASTSAKVCDTGGDHTCKTCSTLSNEKIKAGAWSAARKLRRTHNDNGGCNSCYMCVNNQNGKSKDTGCDETGKPICGKDKKTADNKGYNSCYECAEDAHCPTGKKCQDGACVLKDGYCLDGNTAVKMSDYVDLKRKSATNFTCVCAFNKTYTLPSLSDKIRSSRESYNDDYKGLRSTPPKLLTSTVKNSKLTFYCAHKADFTVYSDDCVYETFLGTPKVGSKTHCKDCYDNTNPRTGHKKAVCHYKKSNVTVPKGTYNSVYVKVADLHKTAISVNGTIKIHD